MKSYVGSKIIQAEPMSYQTFVSTVKTPNYLDPTQKDQPGYKVVYSDGYTSWSPKEVFENAYREVTESEKRIINNVKIG